MVWKNPFFEPKKVKYLDEKKYYFVQQIPNPWRVSAPPGPDMVEFIFLTFKCKILLKGSLKYP